MFVEGGWERAVVNRKRWEKEEEEDWYYEVLCLISLADDFGFGLCVRLALGARLAGLGGVLASLTVCVCACVRVGRGGRV